MHRVFSGKTKDVFKITYQCLLGIVLMFLINDIAAYPSIREVSLVQAQSVINDADELGKPETVIPTIPVYGKKQLLGYIALSNEIIAIPGYSGKPIAVLVGIDLNARITEAHIIYHEEPILVAGIQESQLQTFVKQYRGKKADSKVRIGAFNRAGYEGVDGISGATITAMILNQSIMTTAKNVAVKMQLPRISQNKNQSISDSDTSVEIPSWEYNWREKFIHLIIIGVVLFGLLNILFFQDWLVRHTKFFNIIRISFLLFTVFYIGFWHLAQLSIINILTFVRLVTDQFTWHTLLIDPLIFQLWTFIALVSLLWGGGVFCGWLCPFGAMQELIHKAAEKFGVPEVEFPTIIHERLLSIKYFILIGLVGLSLESLTSAARLAEVEPFKTVFIFQLQRPAVYSIYAISLLFISAFNSKFYCKYLCPLGAALSFFTRLRVFDWLRRRKECGRPCQTCSKHCQMNAIKPTGEIIATECQYCLECQVYYWDEHQCPPLVDKIHRRRMRQHNSVTNPGPKPAEQQGKLSRVDSKPMIRKIINTGEQP